jgi:hypothetical protein
MQLEGDTLAVELSESDATSLADEKIARRGWVWIEPIMSQVTTEQV